ncbi:plasmid mobilization protein [Blautia sp.]|uniref:plasmid mobilization protein n=1 Tax=Blautia sp. TaxID=1955243 RepID=UPI003FA483F2
MIGSFCVNWLRVCGKNCRKRKRRIYVKFKPEEVEILHNRMKEAGVQNMSAYIRKMALNGYVIIPEWPDLNQVISFNDLKCREKDQQGRCSDYN